MTLRNIVNKDAAAKSAHGKATGELPCKYPESTVDLTSHTPAGEREQVGSDWRLTQAGAKAVHQATVAVRQAPPPKSWFACNGLSGGIYITETAVRSGWGSKCSVYAIVRNLMSTNTASSCIVFGGQIATTNQRCEIARFAVPATPRLECFTNYSGSSSQPILSGTIDDSDWIECLWTIDGSNCRGDIAGQGGLSDTTPGALNWSGVVRFCLCGAAASSTSNPFEGDIARVIVCDTIETLSSIRTAPNRLDIRCDDSAGMYDAGNRWTGVLAADANRVFTTA